MEAHRPPATQPLIGKHTATADCACEPTRMVKYTGQGSGRGGRHQGYRTTVEYQHHQIGGS